METKQFKAESKKLLDLMINSIYTNKEIFLRELISNASDAIDKIYYKSLTDSSILVDKEKLEINLSVDKEKRTITIEDNGIGMNKEELESNLGTIAKSGSLAFKNENEKKEDIDIIGQFGVGFYSSFMVAKKIEVISKSYKEEQAYKWESEGAQGYSIEEADKNDVGTKIILYLRDNTVTDDDMRTFQTIGGDNYLVCSENPKSSLMHELMHWYRDKYSRKMSGRNCREYMQRTQKEILDYLIKMQYNTKEEMSEYAKKNIFVDDYSLREEPIAEFLTLCHYAEQRDEVMETVLRRWFDERHNR